MLKYKYFLKYAVICFLVLNFCFILRFYNSVEDADSNVSFYVPDCSFKFLPLFQNLFLYM